MSLNNRGITSRIRFKAEEDLTTPNDDLEQPKLPVLRIGREMSEVHQRPHVIGQKAARGMEHAKNSVIMNWSASNMVNEIFEAYEANSIFNLVNATLGIGVLGLPYCFMNCGVVLTPILMVLCAAFMYHSVQLLVEASFLVKRASYEDIAEKAYGRPGRMVAMIANTCVNLGCLVAYVNVLCDVLSSVANSVIPPGAEPSRWVIMAGVSLLAMLPLSIVLSHRDNSNLLGLMSTVSVAILVVFATVVVAFAFNPIADAKPVHVWKRSGVFVAFPLLSYAFMCHTTLFTAYRGLSNPSPLKMQHVTRSTLGICFLIYFAVGFGGYVAFRQKTAGDILRNFGSLTTGDAMDADGEFDASLLYQRTLKAAYGVSILFSTPLVVQNMLDSVWPEFMHQEPNPYEWNALVLAAMLGALFVSAIVPNVEFVLALTGSTSTTALAFILPPAMYLKLTSPGVVATMTPQLGSPKDGLRPVARMRRIASFLLVFGCLAGVVCTSATLQSLRDEQSVVQLAQMIIQTEHAQLEVRQTQIGVQHVEEALSALTQAQETLSAAKVQTETTLAIINKSNQTKHVNPELSHMVEKIVNSTVESLTGVHGAIQDTEERINHEGASGGSLTDTHAAKASLDNAAAAAAASLPVSKTTATDAATSTASSAASSLPATHPDTQSGTHPDATTDPTTASATVEATEAKGIIASEAKGGDGDGGVEGSEKTGAGESGQGTAQGGQAAGGLIGTEAGAGAAILPLPMLPAGNAETKPKEQNNELVERALEIAKEMKKSGVASTAAAASAQTQGAAQALASVRAQVNETVAVMAETQEKLGTLAQAADKASRAHHTRGGYRRRGEPQLQADVEAAKAMTEALSHTALAANKVNQTLEVLQTEAIHQLEQLYALLGQSIARETRDAAVAAAAAAGSSVLGATLVQQGSNEADKALMEDYRKVGVVLESLRNGTVGGTAVSINESLQSLLNDLKELEETMASRASEKLKTTLEQQVQSATGSSSKDAVQAANQITTEIQRGAAEDAKNEAAGEAAAAVKAQTTRENSEKPQPIVLAAVNANAKKEGAAVGAEAAGSVAQGEKEQAGTGTETGDSHATRFRVLSEQEQARKEGALDDSTSDGGERDRRSLRLEGEGGGLKAVQLGRKAGGV